MSELISVGILAGLALWGYGCYRAGAARTPTITAEKIVPRKARTTRPATLVLLISLFLMLFAEGRAAFGQTATSSVFPANPTYVDAVTSIVTIPAVAGQAPVTGMIDYTIDGGPVTTATVTTGNNYVNLGQLSIGSHVLTFQSHPGSPSASPIVPPHPVSISVTDQSFGFVGVYGRFHSNYTDANLFSSAGIAINSKDTVWIADSILSKLVSFDIFGNINNVAIASLPIPIANPAGLAFDSSDNLFIADRGNSRIIKYTPAGVETVLPTPGLGKPGQLMLDKAKNLLYIVDQDNERVVRYDLSAMAPAGYPFTDLTAIQSIALDPAGNVYVSDNVARFLKNVNGVVSALPVNAPIAEAGGIYVDRAGLLYLTDSSINGTYRIDAQGHQTQISDFDSSHAVAEDSLGRIYFGTSTNVRTFTPAGELGVAAATTSNFSNSDQNNSLVYTMPHGQTALTQVVSPTPPFYYDVETESCPYIEIHGTCYFEVNFAPKVPGVHTGSIATTLPGGPTITTLLYGNATGPAPAFSPGTQTQTPSGAALGENVALDEAGNYYVSDATGNQVYETSGGVTRSLGFKGLSFPNTLAVDGAGAVYVQDSGNNRVAKLDLAGNQTYPVIAGTGNALSSLDSFAMDGGGQIYFAGPAAGGTSIYLYDRTGTTSLVASGLVESASLSLDPYGDIYSLQVDGSLLRIDPYGRQSTLAPAGTFHNHTSLAVDESETAYVAVFGSPAITLVHPGGNTESIPVPGFSQAAGIAIDGTGSILAVDSVTNNFIFVDRTHQDFNFGDVPVNTTTTFSAFFGNAGSEAFQITGLPGDSDFQQVTTADACSTSGTNSTIAAASSCDLSYTVAPTTLGTITAYGRVTTTASVDFDTFTEIVVNAPVLSLTPASFDFGIVPSGKTPFTTLTLSNTGSTPASVDISLFEKVSNDPNNPSSSFAETSACPATLAPGASCGIVVTFNPVPGNQNTATVSVSAPGAASVSATFTGTGAAPVLSLTPSSYDFGSVASGATPSTTLTLKNSGNAPAAVNISLLAKVSNDPSNPLSSFSETSDCPASLAPGASCGILVTFTPVAGSPGTATVSVSAAGAATLNSTLTGTGAPGTPVFSLTPATYAFGNVQPGSTPTTTLTLKNTGTANAALLISLIEKVSNDPDNPLSSFSETSNCPASLAPGANCGIVVTFDPVAGGQGSATLSVNAPGAASVSATFTGTGAAPVLSLTPSSYDFGSVASGATPSTTLTLKNSGNAPAAVSISLFAKVSNDPSNPLSSFSETSNCPASLAPGASCGIIITFTPVAGSPGTATVSVSAAGTATASATLTGTGAPGTPVFSLTPATYAFGNVQPGNTPTTTLTLKNTGTANAALLISLIEKVSNDPNNPLSSFSETSNCPASLAPGASCGIVVTFNTVPGSQNSATVSVTAAGAAAVSSSLTGTGAGPVLTLTPASYSFGTVTPGKTPTTTLTLANSGNAPAAITVSLLERTSNDPNNPSSSFTETSNCLTSLAAGASCAIVVTFNPVAGSQGSATLSVNAPGAATVSSTLTGTAAPAVTAIDFGTGFSTSALTLNGTAAITGGALQLTSGPSAAASSAFFPTPAVTTTFATDFTFQLLDPATEGITFTIQGDGPAAVGSNGGGLGYQGIPNSIALKFDLRDTAGEGVDSTGIYVDGAAPTVPATSLADSGIDLHSGDVFALHIAYDGTTEFITLTDTVTNAVWTTQAAENIPSIVGGSSAYFGFTAGTGAVSADAVSANSQAKSQTASLSGASAKPMDAAATAAPTAVGIVSWTYNTVITPATLAPTALNFGNVTVGSTSGVQAAELIDTGTAQFQVSSITPSDPAIVVHSSYCARPVTPGNYCKLEVTVAPTASGTFTGSVAINYYLGDGALPNQNFTSTLKITGTGTVSSVTLSPPSADFGSISQAQTSSPKTFTVTNNSTLAITLTRITIAEDSTLPFQIASGATCIAGAQLPAGKSCTIPAVFAPESTGAISGTLEVSYLDASDKAVTEIASLTGTAIAAPMATLTPTRVDFGNVMLGAALPPAELQLTNTGTLPVTASAFTLTGSGFSIAGGFCGDPIPAGGSCTILIAFQPTVAGVSNGSFGLTTNAGTKTVSLTGVGVAPPIPMANLTPVSYNFGDVPLGAPVQAEFELTNTGTLPVTVSDSTLTGSGFSIVGQSEACLPAIVAGSPCMFLLQFTPTVAGASSGSFILKTNAGDFTVALTGTGVAGTAPTLTLTPARVDFGNVPLGASPVQAVFSLINSGTVPVTLTNVTFTGSGFSLVAAQCANIVAAGSTCMFTAAFQPTAVGASSSNLTLVTDAGTRTVALTGTGVAPPPTTPFINFGTGFTADALTLTGPVNVAGGALELTAGPSSVASSAFYPTPVPTASFTTEFTFQLLDPTAEGITFTIQGDGPNAVGVGGGGLGYQGLAKSIAVKFDLKDTAGEGVDSTGIYVNGAVPTVPAIPLASSGIDLHSGDIFDLRLTYDGTTMTVTLTDTVTNAVWTTQAAEDIPEITGGSSAYFGFTAGSGTPTLSADAAESERAESVRPAATSSAAAHPPATSSAAAQPPATSNILTWIYVANGAVKSSQTINFSALAAKTYSAAPIQLAATATSGLPVSYSVTGPAKLSGATLTLTGAGDVSVTATQSGNASFTAAVPVTRSFAVAKAPLTVTANSVTRDFGAANPALTYKLSGFIDDDTATVVGGTAVLKTTAVPASPAGEYPITFSTEGLAAANYSFTYVAGTLTVTSAASCPNVDYASGFTASGLSLNGGATISDTALELTDGGLFEARSAFFSTPLPTTRFTTDFTFQITEPAADGMTFIIQSNNPTVVGQSGGGLGYAGIPHSVAIKVDLHNNAGEGTDSTGTYIDGAFPSIPAIDLAPAGIDLHSGHIFAVHLSYANGLTMGTIMDTVTGVSASMNFPGDITQIVGNSAWFGFTAGSGAHSATQKILTWSYSGGTGCLAK